MNDADSGLIETATFCRTNDAKRPTIVGLPDFSTTQVCDDDASKGADKVMDAVPTTWFVRVMFDELLDPRVEDLIEVISPETNLPDGTYDGTIANTRPVVLRCGGNEIDYDGYYSPSGNNVTWPLGPSLFIQPADLSTVATSSECTLEIRDIVRDKTGESVPMASRTGYSWNIAPLELTASAPAPAEEPGDEEEITPDAPLVLTFNGFINAASLAAAEVTIKEAPLAGDGSADCAAAAAATRVADGQIAIGPDGDGLSINVNIRNAAVACPGAMAGDPPVACAWNPERTYLIEFAPGNEVADQAGGTASLPEAAAYSLCFTTSAP
ncbi:MAG: hypothetical protein KF773_34375 [Deltaproteobacteria bacterium]|nr:hypothetical protein [Deltaproteobacteria bacterium]